VSERVKSNWVRICAECRLWQRNFHFAPWRYCHSTDCLDLDVRLIVEQNQNTSWFDRDTLDCSAGDNFRQFLVSSHNLLACSTCWGISAIKRIQLRHEFALFGSTVKP
jgi:hypothetical protein